MNYNPTCAANYFGFWFIEPVWASHALTAIQMRGQPVAKVTFEAASDGIDRDRRPYRPDENGVAIVNIAGPMQKFDSKFGGTNTMKTRRVLAQARRDPDVRGVFLHIDESPGGTVAGTAELASAVRSVRSSKPLAAHITDMGASAAYWAASQAERVTANSQAEVGSIGGLAVIDDLSGRAEMLGIKMHAITAPPGAEFKGMGVEGTAITDKHLQQIQTRLSDLTQPFFQAVADGRNVSLERVMALADGRVWIARKAQELGLIDAVTDAETALAEFGASIGPRQAGRMAARNRLRISGVKT